MILSAFVCPCESASAGGVVAEYEFGTDSGTMLRDKSGRGNHAAIVGADWLHTKAGWALEFNGKDNFVSLPLSVFHQDAGAWEMWIHVDYRGENYPGNKVRLFNSRHSREYDGEFRTSGYLSWHCGNTNVGIESEHLANDAWNQVAFTWQFDPSRNLTVVKAYGNGVDEGQTSLAGKIPIPDLNRLGEKEGACITIGEWKGAFFKGLIKDVKIYNRAPSKNEFFNAYLAKAESYGRGRDLSRYKRINVRSCVVPILGKVVVEADYKDLMICSHASSGAFPEGNSLLVAVHRLGAQEPILHQSVFVLPKSGLAIVSFDIDTLEVGKYEVRVIVRDSTGSATEITAMDTFNWLGGPSWLSENPPVTVRNNFVVELLNFKEIPPEASGSFSFRNPRDSWVFFQSTAQVETGGRLSLLLGSDDRLGLHAADGRSTLEAMRYLPAGHYSLNVQSQEATLKRLVVHAIPEIIYCGLLDRPCRPWMSAFGPYDWEYLKRSGVLTNANVINARGANVDNPDHASGLREWTAQGKKWITGAGVKRFLKPKQIIKSWLGQTGMRHPGALGFSIDEVGAYPAEHFRAWTAALHLLANDERAKGKRLYPYCGYSQDYAPSHDWVRAIMRYGHRFLPNTYLGEEPSLGEAEISLDRQLRRVIMGWRRAFPGVERNTVVNLGYMSTAVENLDRYPSVDYKVFMDMQLNIIANDPIFSDILGVMAYNSRNVDEEILRWMAKLYRHYCIEGRRDRLTSDPYILPHMSNGDFEHGAEGWTLVRAARDSISFGRITGYGVINGRYPPSDLGDTFLCTTRNSKGPNRFSQQIVALTPGRTYSLKFITADRQAMHVKETHALSVEIQGVEVLPEKTIHHPYEQVFHGGVVYQPGSGHPWLNFHRLVFRAHSETARLVICDWASATDPGGPEGQQVIFNFVQVQPYFLD